MKMAEAMQTDLSDDDPTIMCDPCSCRGVEILAGTFCQFCLENLCHSCEVNHLSSKALRDHDLKPLEESRIVSIKQNELVSSIMACDVHRTETLTHFCVNHKVPVCDKCTLLKHRNCNTMTLKQVTKEAEVKKDMSLYIDKSKALLSEVKAIKDLTEKEKCLIQDCSRKCLQDVKKIKLQIIAWAETLTKDMEDNIAKTETKLLAEKEGDIKAVVEISKQMQDIVKSFEIFEKDYEDLTFVFMMKEKGNIEDGIEIKDEILKQVKPVKLDFQISEKLVTLMSDVSSMGTLEVNGKQNSIPDTPNRQAHQFGFQEIYCMTNKQVINEVSRSVTGCTFMPDGELVIGDDKSVKVFKKDLKLKNELKFESGVWDVAVLSNTEVIVTQRKAVSLQILSVSDNIDRGRRIPVGRLTCYGIDCKNDKLYIVCNEGNSKKGMVKVINMDGLILKTFNISQEYPMYLAVNSSGDKILVGTNQGEVCLDNNGNTLFTYSARQSYGLLFDSYDNFMVCDRSNDFIDVAKSDGTLHKIILTSEDGFNSPFCLAYRPSDKTLIVGQNADASSGLTLIVRQNADASKALFAFKFK